MQPCTNFSEETCKRYNYLKNKQEDYKRNRINYRNRWKVHYQKRKDYYKNKNNKRRLKIKELYDYVDINYVFSEKCNWVCGICSLPVDKTLKYPDPLSASLDHIIPVSKGGGHTTSNVQLAHLLCNLKKSDKLLTSEQ